MSIKIDKSFYFSGKPIFSSYKSELLTHLQEQLKNDKKGNADTVLVFTPNPEQLVMAEEDQDFNKTLLQADILVPDGMGLVWASKILAKNSADVIKERIPGRFVVASLLRFASREKLSVLLIGGRDYSTTKEVTVEGATISWLEGYEKVIEPSPIEEQTLLENLRKIKPDLVFVAFGAPHQEKWLVAHKKILQQSGVKVAMAVGGSFDYLLGKVPLPPDFMSKNGLEWLFRLITQPWRWRRQLKLINFVILVWKMKQNSWK